MWAERERGDNKYNCNYKIFTLSHASQPAKEHKGDVCVGIREIINILHTLVWESKKYCCIKTKDLCLCIVHAGKTSDPSISAHRGLPFR